MPSRCGLGSSRQILPQKVEDSARKGPSRQHFTQVLAECGEPLRVDRVAEETQRQMEIRAANPADSVGEAPHILDKRRERVRLRINLRGTAASVANYTCGYAPRLVQKLGAAEWLPVVQDAMTAGGGNSQKGRPVVGLAHASRPNHIGGIEF